MDLSALSSFNLIALHGGLGKASRMSGRSKATLSRHVMALEASLGVRLIDRSARGLRLTDEGVALFRRTDDLLDAIKTVGESLSSGAPRPRGRLRVSAPVLFAHTSMGGLAADFARTYPDVILEVTAEDRKVDLVEEGFDLAIRVNPSPDDSLVGRCFARDDLLLAACPSVFEAIKETVWSQPLPTVAMTTGFDSGPWKILGDDAGGTVTPDVRLRLSSLIMIRDAVRVGVGAAILPRSMIQDDVDQGLLMSWGAVAERPIELWALHPSRRFVSPKVSAFLDFLAAAFPDRRLTCPPKAQTITDRPSPNGDQATESSLRKAGVPI